MKFFKLLAIAIAAFTFASPARAATLEVNRTGTDYDLGTVVEGQYGTITTVKQDYPADTRYTMYAYIGGLLNPNTSIVFTYSNDASFESGAIVGESILTGIFDITAMSNGITSVASPSGLVTVLANLAAGDAPKSGTVTISNLSTDVVKFVTYALTRTGSFKGVYSVYGASAVPLPGAAILFGSGLMVLAGLGRKKFSRKG